MNFHLKGKQKDRNMVGRQIEGGFSFEVHYQSTILIRFWKLATVGFGFLGIEIVPWSLEGWGIHLY